MLLRVERHIASAHHIDILNFVYLGMPDYRLNRSAFKAQTAAEAAEHSAYYKTLSWQERLRIAAYLISKAYNFPVNDPPRMDKTAFKASSSNS